VARRTVDPTMASKSSGRETPSSTGAGGAKATVDRRTAVEPARKRQMKRADAADPESKVPTKQPVARAPRRRSPIKNASLERTDTVQAGRRARGTASPDSDFSIGATASAPELQDEAVLDADGAPDAHETFQDIARALKRARITRGMTQRQVAAAAHVSAGLIAQIEVGRTRPSVRTLLDIGRALGLSLDSLFAAELELASAAAVVKMQPPGTTDGNETNNATRSRTVIERQIVRAGERERITLEGGVQWSLLTSEVHDGITFILVTYPPGSASSASRQLVRHDDNEYFYVLQGTLHVRLAFEQTELRAGDSMSFDSSIPHRFENRTKQPVSGVWCVVRKSEFPGISL
jgi:transcriptional regulator with XRE-family HTH domain/quercetin dioxygenase-like cupin family protein